MRDRCDDVPELLRQSDLFVPPSIAEGFVLVCTEAIASGYVPLVSDICTDLSRHMENTLVVSVGDVQDQINYIVSLHQGRELFVKLHATWLHCVPGINRNDREPMHAKRLS